MVRRGPPQTESVSLPVLNIGQVRSSDSVTLQAPARPTLGQVRSSDSVTLQAPARLALG